MAALTLDSLRNAIRTSIYGRRLGLDTTPDPNATFGGSNMRGGFLVGTIGARLPIQYVGTTVASTLFFAGYIELATAPSTVTFANPIPGATVTITQTATSTAGQQIKLSNGNFNSSTGSSAISMFLWGQGVSVTLLGLSTALAAVISQTGMSTLQVSFSTAA